MEFGVWPETAIRLSHRLSSFKKSEAALVALAGRPVTGQVSPCSSSASITDSNADIRIHGAQAPLHPFADLFNSPKDTS
jgi:hypothetical protein